MSEILDKARKSTNEINGYWLYATEFRLKTIENALDKLEEYEQKFEVGVKPYIPTQINRTNDVYCGHCNSRFNGTVDYVKTHQKYCPTCGTKLRSDEE